MRSFDEPDASREGCDPQSSHTKGATGVMNGELSFLAAATKDHPTEINS